jgi:SAM-dependent methyltransferase
MTMEPVEFEHLQAVRTAFDSVAGEYDGDLGNNEIVQRFRSELWKMVSATVPMGSRLLDLGCGTGLDAVHFASLGYQVTATDWSPEMVSRTSRRIADAGLQSMASSVLIGAHELASLAGSEFDAIYSDLGPLNCVPESDMDKDPISAGHPTETSLTLARLTGRPQQLSLSETATACAAAIKPGGVLVASVIGRVCPWEMLYYSAKGQPRRAMTRFSRGSVPVPLNGETVWTTYYTPGRFYKAFAKDFNLRSYRALGLFAPPPYLIGAWRRARQICSTAARIDAVAGTLPGLRNAGDHFLMVMSSRRSSSTSYEVTDVPTGSTNG